MQFGLICSIPYHLTHVTGGGGVQLYSVHTHRLLLLLIVDQRKFETNIRVNVDNVYTISYVFVYVYSVNVCEVVWVSR